MPRSAEYTKPRAIIVHSPQINTSLFSLSQANLKEHNYNSVPDRHKLIKEFQAIAALIRDYGLEVIELADLLNQAEIDELAQDPNAMFTRDPLITLPWMPRSAIVSNMALPGRQSEPGIMKTALSKAGITHFLTPPEDVRLEGGDVLAVLHEGQRVLYVGNGDRTNLEAVLWLAENLIPQGHIDQIICFKHNRAMLHLDTCFAILPNNVLLCARDTFREGFMISADMQLKPIEPLEYLKSQNFRLIYMPQSQAEREEICNLLYLGDDNYLSFKLPEDLSVGLEALSGIKIHQIDGSEIAKANGGVHCLTLPLY